MASKKSNKDIYTKSYDYNKLLDYKDFMIFN